MKKLCLLFISIFMIGINSYSQDLIPNQNDKGKWGYVDGDGKVVIKHDYKEVSAFIDGRAKVRKGDKWGYINALGKEVIKIQYSEMRTWEGNYCKVAIGGKIEDGMLTSGGKWGYINRNGDVVLKCEYDEIGAYKDGLAHIKKGDKFGYIDTNYQIFIPCIYSAIGSFNEQGFCWVNEGGKFDKSNSKKVIGGKYGIYNRRGELIIPAKYKMIGTFTHTPAEANPFIANIIDSEEYTDKAKKILKSAWNQRDNNNDLRKSHTYAKDSLKALLNRFINQMPKEDYNLMKECGNYDLLSYEFLNPEKFSTLEMPINNYFAVSNNYNEVMAFDWRTARTNRSDKIGIISEFGEIILEPGKYAIAYLPTENLVPVAQEKSKKLQVNYFNTKTKQLMFKKWIEASGISPFKNGVAVIINDDTQYLINTNGDKISADYNFILPPKEDTYIVKRGSYGLVNKDGTEIITPTYNSILPISENLMCAQQNSNGTFGYLNSMGQYVIPSKYLEAKSFNNGAALVKTEKGWGEINNKDHNIIECQWEDIKPRSMNNPTYSWVKKSNLWYGLDLAKNKLITKGYSDAYNFNSENIAYVRNENNLIGAINASDELIIPCQLSNIDMAKKCYQIMKENNQSSMQEVEVYRFNLMFDDRRNEFRLTEKITDNLWDF